MIKFYFRGLLGLISIEVLNLIEKYTNSIGNIILILIQIIIGCFVVYRLFRDVHKPIQEGEKDLNYYIDKLKQMLNLKK